MTTSFAPEPGFMVLHGNRLEDLRALVMDWLARNPLPPMEDEVLLVQSNGIAQWLKMAMAAFPGDDMHGNGWGVAFGIDVMLPGRFQWQVYRHVLEAVEGPGTLPGESPFDKARLRWRLMKLIPERVDDALFRPLHHFLGDDPDQRKRFQLAERLADLYDQYQVYRPHWLAAWATGDDVILSPRGDRRPLDEEQRWQAQLWRDLLAAMPEEQRAANRAAIHQRFLRAAGALSPDTRPPGLPPRVIVFGVSALPQQVLHTLSALSGAAQVILCAVNPCRHYWGDIVEQRDLLRAEYRRQHRRPGMPAAVDEAELHLHAHPLLAAWGKQGRDYLHLLDEHDNPPSYQGRFHDQQLRIEAFVSPDTGRLLGQLQDDILELRPLAETRTTWPPVDAATDDSIVFHVAHSPQRELEVLHDQLLDAFRRNPELRPRDVIVMVPDINGFAPAIEAVFGQYRKDDPRHIPYQVSDRQLRHRAPLLVALEQLLSLPRLRFRASEVLELLEVPALRTRFAVQEGDLPVLQRWVRGANIRWGLHARQRASLDLPEHTDTHSWRFGLQRMLVGYAVGEADWNLSDWDGVVPYAEVAGLQAELVGALFRLVETLDHHREAMEASRSPGDWAEHLRTLLEDCFEPVEKQDVQLLERLRDGLDGWLGECEDAGFHDPLPLAIVRESWLSRLDEPRLSQRFLGGAVTFATLMPMRAIPFRQVCLLGMNDSDYPRKTIRTDFDLMAMPGQYAPGDRSRRDDDRYLFLEALLSARERLYVSWSGRSLQDNSRRPPSVLVGQLRDHLAAGWRMAGDGDDAAGDTLLDALTTEHPLQPFSAIYFTRPAGRTPADARARARQLAARRRFTHAAEWENLHRERTRPRGPGPLKLWVPDNPINLQQLAGFLRNPVQAFFRERLKVRFGRDLLTSEDDEPFDFDNLGAWQQRDQVLQAVGRQLALTPAADAEQTLELIIRRRQLAGDFPPPPFGRLKAGQIADSVRGMLVRYQDALMHYPQPEHPEPVLALDSSFPTRDPETGNERQMPLALEDTVEGLRRAGDGRRCRMVLSAGNLHTGKPRGLRWSAIVHLWPTHLALQLVYPQTPTRLFTPSEDLVLDGLPADQARRELLALMHAWLDGMQQPLPATVELGIQALGIAPDGNLPPDLSALADTFELVRDRSPEFARCFETLEDLRVEPGLLHTSRRLYGSLLEHVGSRQEAD
ncbi:MAG: exodeoxyribonuclease V subunit gamma [Ectothiorhodospiraceae bacterium]|nr:exodeoxyribonuclease V subunit gamma [Ectothiorhodospiraceae bacterium]